MDFCRFRCFGSGNSIWNSVGFHVLARVIPYGLLNSLWTYVGFDASARVIPYRLLYQSILLRTTHCSTKNLPPGSLQSWTELCRSIFSKFSYTNMTNHLRNQITSFRQEDDEAMRETWERYSDLFRRCPMHQLPKWTQVSIFYNSVNTPTRMMLNASASGTLLDKPPRESLENMEKIAENDYQHPTTRRGNTR
ncbi:hypothetical protein GQ457_06G015600 [Hibiscus cannabinus]